MARIKTGSKPKITEYTATFIFNGKIDSRSAKSMAKLEALVPAGASKIEINPTKWEAYYWAGDKKKWATGRTPEEVLARIGSTSGLGKIVTATDNHSTFGGYARRYLNEQLRDNKIEQGTYNLEMSYLDNHIMKPFTPGVQSVGATAITMMKRDVFQAFLNAKTTEWKTSKAGASTIVRCHAIFRKVWNAIMEDPEFTGTVLPISFNHKASRHAVAIDPMLKEVEKGEPLTRQDWESIVEACADGYEKAMVGLAMCGLRPPGEILGQQWVDINDDKHEMFVRHQVRCEKQLDGSYEVIVKDHTKTKLLDPRRKNAIPITDRAWDLIQSTRSLGSEFVVPSPRGDGPMHPDTASKRWKALLQRAGVSHRRFYITRHSVTTQLVQDGADMKTVQLMGGWASAKTALDEYARHDTEQARKWLRQMGVLSSATASFADLLEAVEAAPMEVKLQIMLTLSTQPLASVK